METTNWDELSIKPSEVDILVYHADCVDGFGCVVSAEYYMRRMNNPHQILYVPAKYNQELDIDVDGKNVIFCDFSYKKEKMDKIVEKAKNILILDHHKTAVQQLEHIGKSKKVLDMDHSGAYITWVYFNGKNNIPLLIQYIQDNDIWKKSMNHTEEIYSYLNSIPKNILDYYPLLDDQFLLSKKKIGRDILKNEDDEITKIIENRYTRQISIYGNIYTVAVVECPIYKYKSKLGNRMLYMYDSCDFCIIYNYDETQKKTYTSLRSENSRTDVSYIASLYGGGGHRNASGICFDGCVEHGLHDL